MSHEWDCRCSRCRRDMQAWVDRDDDQAEHEADELEAARYGARVPDAS